jgi:hypothetical protein
MSFENWWEIWPNKKAKKDALKAWPQAVKDAGSENVIMDGTRGYIKNKEPWKSWMLPATFLRGARWEDEYEEDNPVADMSYEERREYGRKLMAGNLKVVK